MPISLWAFADNPLSLQHRVNASLWWLYLHGLLNTFEYHKPPGVSCVTLPRFAASLPNQRRLLKSCTWRLRPSVPWSRRLVCGKHRHSAFSKWLSKSISSYQWMTTPNMAHEKTMLTYLQASLSRYGFLNPSALRHPPLFFSAFPLSWGVPPKYIIYLKGGILHDIQALLAWGIPMLVGG